MSARGSAESTAVEPTSDPERLQQVRSASVGAMPLAELCRTLEADARGGAVADPAGRAAAVASAFEAASAALQASDPG